MACPSAGREMESWPAISLPTGARSNLFPEDQEDSRGMENYNHHGDNHRNVSFGRYPPFQKEKWCFVWLHGGVGGSGEGNQACNCFKLYGVDATIARIFLSKIHGTNGGGAVVLQQLVRRWHLCKEEFSKYGSNSSSRRLVPSMLV